MRDRLLMLWLGRVVAGLVVAGLILAAAMFVEHLFGIDPTEYMVPNVVGALVIAAFFVPGPAWAQVGIALATTLVSIVALVVSLSALRLAEVNEDRLNNQDRQRFAELIHVGEPPAAAYEVTRSEDDCRAALGSDQPDCVPKQYDRIWYQVINPSGIQVEDVWVTNKSRNEVVAIGGLERCSMYYLPHWVSDEPNRNAPDRDLPGHVEFTPGELYFTDPVGHWRRPLGGQVEWVPDEEYRRIKDGLAAEDNGISPYSDMLPNCAG